MKGIFGNGPSYEVLNFSSTSARLFVCKGFSSRLTGSRFQFKLNIKCNLTIVNLCQCKTFSCILEENLQQTLSIYLSMQISSYLHETKSAKNISSRLFIYLENTEIVVLFVYSSGQKSNSWLKFDLSDR